MKEFNWVDEDGTYGPTTSLNVMGGFSGSVLQTIRVIGKHKKNPIHILIDSGSTHNFVGISVIKGLDCRVKLINPVCITVANEQEMVCNHLCEQFKWEMQGHVFDADFLVLPIGGCEMVLGIHWLATLGTSHGTSRS